MNKPRTKFWSAMLALILAAVCACSFVLVACAPSDPGPGPGPDDSATVESLVLDASGAKTTFAYGEEFTYDGLKVTAKMSDGSEKEVPTDECRISAPSMSSPGQRRVTVSYGGKSAQYTITVLPRADVPARHGREDDAGLYPHQRGGGRGHLRGRKLEAFGGAARLSPSTSMRPAAARRSRRRPRRSGQRSPS